MGRQENTWNHKFWKHITQKPSIKFVGHSTAPAVCNTSWARANALRNLSCIADLLEWKTTDKNKKKIPVYTQSWGKDGVAMTDKVVQARRRLKRREKYIWQHISSLNKNLCNSHVQQHCVLVYRLFQERAGRARQEVCCTPGRPDEVTLTFVSNREWGRFQIMHELKKSWLDGSEL